MLVEAEQKQRYGVRERSGRGDVDPLLVLVEIVVGMRCSNG